MEPKIVNREACQVLGILSRINPMEADYQTLWGRGFDARYDEIAPRAVEPGYYGVYYATDEPPIADFIAGMAVGDVDEVPEGLTLQEVPGGTYALFECPLGELTQTWGQIYSRWLPQSAYAEDESRPSLEYYPPNEAMGPNWQVSISLPVKEK